MFTQDHWMLPEGIEEIFPAEAESLDRLGRRLMKAFGTWGYRPVIPPMVDYLDSLLTGSGHALDLQTVKFSDPISGRLMGLRADMTPQVARIDARTARPEVPARFCYLGAVIHGIVGHLEKNRNPLQIGAELFGHNGLKATQEVIRLMLDMLATADVRGVHLDLGHVGLYRALAKRAGLSEAEERRLFEVLQRKDTTELVALLAQTTMSEALRQAFSALPELHGPLDCVAAARGALTAGGEPVMLALDELSIVGNALKAGYPDLPLHVDLAELRGYDYHTGMVFAAFVPGEGREIARGGRYDDIGGVFGCARPAVGFSADLRTLARLGAVQGCAPLTPRILAPAHDDPALAAKIADLRAEGHVVIQALGGSSETAEALECPLTLVFLGGQWVLNDSNAMTGTVRE